MRVVEMDDHDAITIFETLGSETTYTLYRELQREPQTPKELAEALDTSLQNIHYHIDKLEEASLIETVDTWYSKKGIEMSVYAPAHSPLVISFADHAQQQQLRSTLSQTFALFGLLAVLSVLVELAVRQFVTLEQAADGTTQLDSEIESPNQSGDAPITISADSISTVTETALSSPGLTVFLIGSLVVTGYAALRLRSTQSQ